MKLSAPANAITELKSISFKGNRILVHQANCWHTMGGGIAAQLAREFPSVVQADKNTPLGPSKLGTFSCAPIYSPLATGLRGVYNIYGQDRPGTELQNPDGRATSYDALYNGLQRALTDWAIGSGIHRVPSPVEVIIPWKIGCGLAGGSWTIVQALLEDLDAWAYRTYGEIFTLNICQRKEDMETVTKDQDEPADS